jgi:hypothetical protein
VAHEEENKIACSEVVVQKVETSVEEVVEGS